MMRLLRVLLFAVLMAYWGIFVLYTVEKAITGGPHAVIAWYEHVETEGDLSRRWNAERFLLTQTAALAITVGLWLTVRRGPDKV